VTVSISIMVKYRECILSSYDGRTRISALPTNTYA